MSNNIKTSQQNLLPSQRAQTGPQTVGQDYSTRRTYLNSTVLPQKPVDGFRQTPQRTKADSSAFEPNATYRNPGRIKAQNAPAYKMPLHHYVEKGMAPVVESPVKRPTDGAMLKFLDKIIGNQALWTEINVRKATWNTGTPAKPAPKA